MAGRSASSSRRLLVALAAGLLGLSGVSGVSGGTLAHASPARTSAPATTSTPKGDEPAATRRHTVRLDSAELAGARTSSRLSAGSTSALLPAPGPGGLTMVPSTRVLDTRSATGPLRGPFASGSVLEVQVTGVGGIPASGVAGVVVNVTAVTPTSGGHLTVYPAGQATPGTSTLNFPARTTVANLTLVPVSSTGTIAIKATVASGGSTHVLVDVSGYLSAGDLAAAGATHLLTPARVLDTRYGTGGTSGPVVGRRTVTLSLAGQGGMPSTGAGFAFLNLTATSATRPGFVQVHAAGTPVPSTSNLNFAAGQTVAGLVLAPLSTDGKALLEVTSSGSVQLVADVVGYATASGPSESGTVGAVEPERLIDTRADLPSPLGPRESLVLQITDDLGNPVSGLSAVAMTVTVTQPTANGYISVLAGGAGLPPTSSLNFLKGQTVANLTLTPIDENGEVAVYLGSSGAAEVIVDLFGVVAGPPADITPPAPLTFLTARANGKSSADLRWGLQADPSVSGTRIRRTVGYAPAESPYSDVGVYDGPGDSTTDVGLTPGTAYTYAAATHDATPNYAFPVTASMTVPDLSWASTLMAPPRGGLSDISCPTSSWCAAVDAWGSVVVYSGGLWSAPTALPFTTTDRSPANIDCPVAGQCVASVGRELARLAGGSWTSLGPVPGTSAAVSGLACWDATSGCMVLNFKTWSRWDGQSFTAPVALSSPVGWSDIDCVSASFCVAIGINGISPPLYRATWNGSSWTSAVLPRVAGTNSVQHVACPTVAFCLLTDDGWRYWTIKGSTVTYASLPDVNGMNTGGGLSCSSATSCMITREGIGYSLWNGSSWTAWKSATKNALGAISCASGTCISATYAGGSARWVSGVWTSLGTIDPLTGPLVTASCVSTARCLVGDSSGLIYTWNGSAWSVPQALLPDVVDTLACSTADFCIAASGTVFRTVSNGVWSALRTSPVPLARASCVGASCLAGGLSTVVVTATSMSVKPGPPTIATGNGFHCFSMSSCLTMGPNSQWSRWNGSAWSAAVTLEPSAGPSTFGCGPTRCVATTSNLSFRYIGGSWSPITRADSTSPGTLGQISCFSDTNCVGLTGTVPPPAPMARNFNGETWNSGIVSLADLTNLEDEVTALDCPGPTTCLAVSRSGRVNWST